jgi:hypothetical protein
VPAVETGCATDRVPFLPCRDSPRMHRCAVHPAASCCVRPRRSRVSGSLRWCLREAVSAHRPRCSVTVRVRVLARSKLGLARVASKTTMLRIANLRPSVPSVRRPHSLCSGGCRRGPARRRRCAPVLAAQAFPNCPQFRNAAADSPRQRPLEAPSLGRPSCPIPGSPIA